MITDYGLMVYRNTDGCQFFGQKGGVGVDDITQKELGADTENLSCADWGSSVPSIENRHARHPVTFLSQFGITAQSGQNKSVNIIPRSRQFVNQKIQQKTCKLSIFVV
jgi:hypothetical protein